MKEAATQSNPGEARQNGLTGIEQVKLASCALHASHPAIAIFLHGAPPNGGKVTQHPTKRGINGEASSHCDGRTSRSHASIYDGRTLAATTVALLDCRPFFVLIRLGLFLSVLQTHS